MRTTMWLLLAVAMLVAACGSSDETAQTPEAEESTAEESTTDTDDDRDDGDDSPDDEVSESPAAGAEETDDEGDVEVEVRSFAFQPQDVEVEVGETVTWTNGDATRHTVTSGTGEDPTDAFDQELEDRSDTVSVTFTEPGEYVYHCEPHPFMEGTVTVVE